MTDQVLWRVLGLAAIGIAVAYLVIGEWGLVGVWFFLGGLALKMTDL